MTRVNSFCPSHKNFSFYIEPSLCVLQVRAAGKIDPVQGLEAVKYVFEEHALDNGVHNELNKCFCREPGKCFRT